MKSTSTPFLSLAGVLALGSVLLLSACSRTENTGAGTSDTAATPATTDTAGTTASTMATTTDSWDNLQAYTYDQRSEFQQKVDAMAERLEDRAENASGETQRQLAEARDELRSASAEISNATSETWEATKERIGRAWQKAESAVEGVAE